MGSFLLFALASSLLQLAFGAGISLQKRIPCYHDNCLRSLQANSAQANVFCSGYLQGSLATTALAYTTPCTERPNAVSTACSCLLYSTTSTSMPAYNTSTSMLGTSTTTTSTTATSTTTTSTTTTSTATTSTATTSSAPSPTGIAQCDASNNYGFKYDDGAYDRKSLDLNFMFPQVWEEGDCCKLCWNGTYSTPEGGCYGFDVTFSSGYYEYYCELAIIRPYLGIIGPNVSPTCPHGQYYWPDAILDPFQPNSTGGSGQGPCGIFPN